MYVMHFNQCIAVTNKIDGALHVPVSREMGAGKAKKNQKVIMRFASHETIRIGEKSIPTVTEIMSVRLHSSK